MYNHLLIISDVQKFTGNYKEIHGAFDRALLIAGFLFVGNSFSQSNTCTGETTITPIFVESCTSDIAFKIRETDRGATMTSHTFVGTYALGKFVAISGTTTVLCDPFYSRKIICRNLNAISF